MKYKKGVSGIVVVVILVALVLIAVGIVWAVVNNLITEGAGTIDYQQKCVVTNVKATAVACTAGGAGAAILCDITLSREGTGTDATGGVKIVFKNATGNGGVQTSIGNIPALVGLKLTGFDSGMLEDELGAAGSESGTIEVTTYFLDAEGDQRLCSQINPFNF